MKFDKAPSFLKQLLMLLFVTVAMTDVAMSKRVALIIGNNDYQHVPKLQKATNDADSISRELKEAGFTVTLQKNLNFRNMVRSIDRFSSSISPGDEVVFFFAGHGVQIKSGNYILPTDIDADSEGLLERTSFGLNDLTDKLAESKPAFTLVVVDACRDNPLRTKSRSFAASRGLSPVEPAKGQMVVYSASRGQQALDRLNDNDSNPNGVFTREFISRIKEPGIRIEEMMREVQEAVEKLASTVNHDQRPAIYNEARGNFYFYAPTINVNISKSKAASETSKEDTFWSDAKSSGNKEAFEAYINKYPNGQYVSLAKANILKLCGKDCADPAETKKAILAELSLWDSAKRKPSRMGFQNYLNKYPNGFFAAIANENIELIIEEEKLIALQKDNSATEVQKQEQKKIVAETKSKIEKEEIARISLVKSLVTFDVPSF